MKWIISVIITTGAFAQSHVLQLCDQQSPKHCLTLAAPSTLAFNPSTITISGNSGALLIGIASTDLSVLPGAVVSGDTFASITATTNASVGALAAIAGNYVAVSSSHSGSGTNLPMAFFTGGSERARIKTDGTVGIGTTSPASFNGSVGMVLGVKAPGSSNSVVSVENGGASSSGTGAIIEAVNQTASSGDKRLGQLSWLRDTDITSGKLSSYLDLYVNNDGSVTHAFRVNRTGATIFDSSVTASWLGSTTFVSATTDLQFGGILSQGTNTRIDGSGNASFGTVVDRGQAETISTGTTDPRGVVSTEYQDSNFAATFTCRKARGTEATPTTLNDGQTICSDLMSAYNGSNWVYPAYVATVGRVSGSNIGGEFHWATRNNVGGSLVESMILGMDGRLLTGLVSTDVSSLVGSIISSDAFISVTAASNASVGGLAAVAGNYVALSSSHTGSGTNLPLALFTGGIERARMTVAGTMLYGLTSTDVSTLVGAIVSSDAFISATAATNASVGGLAAVAGNYVALSSSHSGSGTNLPFALFTGGAERYRVLTNGQVLIGRTTDDGTGSLFEVNGAISVSSCTGCGSGVTSIATSSPISGGTITATGTISCPTCLVTGGGQTVTGLETFSAGITMSGGTLLSGLTSSDVSVLTGAIVSVDAFVSVTAATNASVGSLAAIASNYVAVSSSRTGSGSFLPMAFFTSASERLRIQTNGHIKVTNGSTTCTTLGGSSCSMTSGSNDTRGAVSITGAAGQATVFFSSVYAAIPFCVAGTQTSSGSFVGIISTSTNSFTVGSNVTGTPINYVCVE